MCIRDRSSAYVTSYEQCIRFLKENTVSLLLLDINLGGRSGFSLCKKLREQTDIPILFISARTSDDDILTALNIGGDDYITKPYTLSVLLAKVKAVLKRCARSGEAVPLRIADVEIDLSAHKVTVGGKPVKLKEMEFRLLTYLAQNLGRVVTKEELLENVWPDQMCIRDSPYVPSGFSRYKGQGRSRQPSYLNCSRGRIFRKGGGVPHQGLPFRNP